MTLESSEAAARHRRFLFADFELDLERGSLLHAGEEVALRPKSFAMLQFLLERAGRLVSREQLMAAVWPGVVVTDDSVAQCLVELRRALDDTDRTMIRTIPRRGLVLDVPVQVEGVGAEAEADQKQSRGLGRRGGLLASAFAIVVMLVLSWFLPLPQDDLQGPPLPPASANSIVVLRFTDLSPQGDQEYLADGLSEEIMHRLAQTSTLRVIARASSFAVAGLPISTISEQLGVSYVLEGSIRKEGDKLRVTAQLIDAETSAHVWSKTYDRDMSGILDLQEEIAEAVAAQLHVSLAESSMISDIDPRAYELYLEGRYFYTRRADGDRSLAQERFEQALSTSPEFATAWAALAATINARLGDVPAPEIEPTEREALRAAQQHAVTQALRFGPNLAEVQHRAAQYYFYNGDKERALAHLETARSIDPDHWLVQTALANDLRKLGRIEDAVSITRQQVQHDPLNIVLRSSLVNQLTWANQFDQAQIELDRMLELLPAQAAHSLLLSSKVPLLQILRREFQAAVDSAHSLPDGPRRSQLLALAYDGLGRPAESRFALQQLTNNADPWTALYAAEVHAYRGAGKEAMGWLKRVELDPDCDNESLAQSVYYSPFLAQLEGWAAWVTYRSEVLEMMKECHTGLAIDPA